MLDMGSFQTLSTRIRLWIYGHHNLFFLVLQMVCGFSSMPYICSHSSQAQNSSGLEALSASLPLKVLNLFEPRSIVVPPALATDLESIQIQIPVGSRSDLSIVEIGTPVVVLVSFLYIVYVTLAFRSRLEDGRLSKQKGE